MSSTSKLALVVLGSALAPAAFFLPSCDSKTETGYRSTSTTASDYRLRDRDGRELLLHGVNARVEGLFDVTFDDGRIPLEPIPPFTEEDCRIIGEDLGMNHLRLPVNWSGIEPENDQFDEAYIDRILEVAAMCERHGVLTLVDFHQDAFSKEIGEDGAPLWAIHPAPTELLQGPLHDLQARRLSRQVRAAFDSFNSNLAGEWDEFAEMARHVAERVDGQPGVLGIEIFNEPDTGLDQENLLRFHQFMVDEIRGVAPDMMLFFEPFAYRNLLDKASTSVSIERSNVVYAPHVYSDVFEDGWAAEDVGLVERSVVAARVEADVHGASLYVGEFGHDDSARGALYTETAMDQFDANNASWALWLYEEWSQGSWGLYDATSEPPARVGLRTARADLVARSYPAAIDGHVTSFTYDSEAKRLTVSLARAGSREHVLAAPTRTFPNGVVVTCDGTEVAARVEAGRAYARCRGATLVLAPAP